MIRRDAQELLTFEDAAGWEAWLAAHHDDREEAWLKIAKKGSGQTSISVGEALDVALCIGWIDGLRRSLDETWFLQRYTPRRPSSSWSKINVERVSALTAAGRMRAPGLAQVLAAQADGRWDAAYESQRLATVPADLAAALERNEDAASAFEALGRSDRYAVILPVLRARSAAVRDERVRQAVDGLSEGRRARTGPRRRQP